MSPFHASTRIYHALLSFILNYLTHHLYALGNLLHSFAFFPSLAQSLDLFSRRAASLVVTICMHGFRAPLLSSILPFPYLQFASVVFPPLSPKSFTTTKSLDSLCNTRHINQSSRSNRKWIIARLCACARLFATHVSLTTFFQHEIALLLQRRRDLTRLCGLS